MNRVNERNRLKSEDFIALPPPIDKGTMSVEESLSKRRSVRKYSLSPLTPNQISKLMWAAQGLIHHKWGSRTAPSAGGTYPLELCVLIKKGGVIDLDEGIYRYIPSEHLLLREIKGDYSKDLMDAAMGQQWMSDAALNIVISAIFQRTKKIYGERGVQYVWQESGHVGQNICLEATSLGLGTVVVGAFYDDMVKRIFRFLEDETPLYIIPVGKLI
jgi:SagB-type dehydrogenase family enzyme